MHGRNSRSSRSQGGDRRRDGQNEQEGTGGYYGSTDPGYATHQGSYNTASTGYTSQYGSQGTSYTYSSQQPGNDHYCSRPSQNQNEYYAVSRDHWARTNPEVERVTQNPALASSQGNPPHQSYNSNAYPSTGRALTQSHVQQVDQGNTQGNDAMSRWMSEDERAAMWNGVAYVSKPYGDNSNGQYRGGN